MQDEHKLAYKQDGEEYLGDSYVLLAQPVC